MNDLVLKGATVVDGTGAPGYVADVAISGGRIVDIGTNTDPATRLVDCTGMVVCPGFIDVHTHYDAQLLWDPNASPSPLHGVTTVFAGNCGFSIAPLAPGDATYIKRMMAVVEGMPIEALDGAGDWDWNSFGDFLDQLEGQIAVNAGFMVGHSAVRRMVMGARSTSAEATPEELAQMVQVVRESVEAGALGFSSSLGEGHLDGEGEPVPSRAATFDEFVALAGAVRDQPGTTLEFIPAVGPIAAERMDLMADMSLAADRPLNWNLLGSLESTEIYQEQLVASDVAKAKGAHVIALTLPDMMRMRASTMLQRLPGWADILVLDEAGRRAAAEDLMLRAMLRDGAEQAAATAIGVLADFNLMEIADTESPYVGRCLADVATERGTDVIDVLIDIVLVEGLTLYMVLPSLTPTLGRSDEAWAVRAAVWKDPRVMLGGSDSGAHLDLMCHANYPSVVLGEAVRDRGLLSIEEAVAMMTSTPAKHYGLRDRGVVAVGAVADLVVFDPEAIATTASEIRTDLPGGGERLYAAAVGIDRVLVAGQEVVEHGEFTNARPGTLLRAGRDTETVTLASLR